MRKFFVTKSDKARIDYLKKAVETVQPSNLWILCEPNRKGIYSSFKAKTMPLKKLNHSDHWIDFVTSIGDGTMLVIDNILQFMYWGDGKKKYLKDISQGIKNVISFDVVPFFTDASEIFYPFYFLDKSILGYNSLNTFRANHNEEAKDKSIKKAHSYEILGDKIRDYYDQDYTDFWKDRTYVDWEMTEADDANYQAVKKREADQFTNPIKMYNACSVAINLIPTKFAIIDELTRGKQNCCVVINALGRFPLMFKKHMQNKSVDFISFHSAPETVSKYDHVILAEMPIVKPYRWFYMEPYITGELYQLRLTNNKLETLWYNRIFKSDLREKLNLLK